ncbi:hypothetical protein E2C01_036436 [Portunus trituberculatus]|uniref:Uncharacterized protein n=1 Tax=Portunus trituberculatus TaxID=210409 RepID=A0A5B7FE63_PORTR|nr:hypothetical protein [Portunus trituberculatus]
MGARIIVCVYIYNRRIISSEIKTSALVLPCPRSSSAPPSSEPSSARRDLHLLGVVTCLSSGSTSVSAVTTWPPLHTSSASTTIPREFLLPTSPSSLLLCSSGSRSTAVFLNSRSTFVGSSARNRALSSPIYPLVTLSVPWSPSCAQSALLTPATTCVPRYQPAVVSGHVAHPSRFSTSTKTLPQPSSRTSQATHSFLKVASSLTYLTRTTADVYKAENVASSLSAELTDQLKSSQWFNGDGMLSSANFKRLMSYLLFVVQLDSPTFAIASDIEFTEKDFLYDVCKKISEKSPPAPQSVSVAQFNRQHALTLPHAVAPPHAPRIILSTATGLIPAPHEM